MGKDVPQGAPQGLEAQTGTGTLPRPPLRSTAGSHSSEGSWLPPLMACLNIPSIFHRQKIASKLTPSSLQRAGQHHPG